MNGSRADNLNRAAKVIRRFAQIEGGPSEFEGISLMDIAHDCAMAAADEKLYERVAQSFARADNVVDLHSYSRRVGA